jgi:hypothetical protein
MTFLQNTARHGVTLRHWTTDAALFVGGRQGPGLPSGDHGLADGRSRNLLDLLASKLKLLRARTDEPDPGVQ